MDLYVLDPRETWVAPQIEAARARGWAAREIKQANEARAPGYVFVRPHANPRVLTQNQCDYEILVGMGLVPIQDATQIQVYEDKRSQTALWGDWMPETRVVSSLDAAHEAVNALGETIVSKADVGASSYNVRILAADKAREHVRQIFGPGVRVRHCAGGKDVWSVQNDYAILQRFIPHEVTYRVNIVGSQRAIFLRRNHDDRPVAQTGNTEPVTRLDERMESLLEYADSFFAAAGTRWCAIDVLEAEDGWKLLETSLAWPWPSPGRCDEARFFPCGQRWECMWDVMLDEIEKGVFGGLD